MINNIEFQVITLRHDDRGKFEIKSYCLFMLMLYATFSSVFKA